MVFLVLLLGCYAVDFGQIGNVDSGHFYMNFPKNGGTAGVPYNIAFTNIPNFAIALTAFDFPFGRVFQVLHQAKSTTTRATITWNVASIPYFVHFRWLAVSGGPLYVLPFKVNNVNNGTNFTYTFDSELPNFYAQNTIMTSLFISGFKYECPQPSK